MAIKLFDYATGSLTAETIALKDEVFARAYNPALIHQVVESYRATGRSGTKAQKGRSEVSGGGIKPWRQKGTGRARAGTTRSPIWRTGGVAFAAKPRDFTQKINKKMYSAALSSILSELIREERLVVVKELAATGKTKEIATKLQNWQWKSLLVIMNELNLPFYLAARNLPRVIVSDLSGVNPLDLIAQERVLFTVDALRMVEEWLA